jgi:hypothetical protein
VNQETDDDWLSTQSKTADMVWTKSEWKALCAFLHNGNPANRFVMAWRKDGLKHYAKSSKIQSHRAIDWAWRTITSETAPQKRLAFVPYSQNPNGLSRWGCLDFDAHDHEHNRAKKYAYAAFRILVNTGLFTILESSGEGWHVWVIGKDFRPVRDWVLLLRGIAKAIGAPLQTGACEIFPDGGDGKIGRGVRAPGSWNPGTDALNGIFWENTASLLEALLSPIGKVPSAYSVGFPDIENNKSLSLYVDWERRWKDAYAIVADQTRHDTLLGLCGEIFSQVGKSSARKLVEAQYDNATANMAASKKEHLKEFEAIWANSMHKWLSSLSSNERKIYDTITSENVRDGFRIVWSFSRLAAKDGRSDFPIARNNFASRLDVTPQGGGHIRDGLSKIGAITLTKHYVQYKTATHYSWTA